MAASTSLCWAAPALLLLFSLSISIAANPFPSLDTFIVQTHNSSKRPHFPTHHDWYASILSSTNIIAAPPRRIVYTSALSPQEAHHLSAHPNVLTLYPDRFNHLFTNPVLPRPHHLQRRASV